MGDVAAEGDAGQRAAAVVGLARRMDVRVSRVAVTQCDQIAVRGQVGLHVSDGPADPAHVEGQLTVLTGADFAVEGDGVAAGGRGAGRLRDDDGLVVAGKEESAPATTPIAARRIEVGEQPPRSGGPIQPGGPRAVGGQLGVDVLNAGVVAADRDQVRPVVRRVVGSDRLAARPKMRKRTGASPPVDRRQASSQV